MSSILSASNISAGYAGVEVIRGLSFRVEKGEVLAVAGANGSGKTTLLRALVGIIPLMKGQIRFFGKERPTGGEAERLIAYIPQRMELDSTFPISLREMLGLSVRGAAIEKYLDMLELRGLLSKKVGELSGGQLQRALLAYAIIKEPSLLIMDEPTSWVDAKGADCVLCIMEEFKKRGIAMVIVTHDFPAVRSVATHVLLLGAEGHFFGRADNPSIEEILASFLGTRHHHGREHGLICPLWPDKKGGVGPGGA